ncbi:protein root UVB sensitive 6 [Senna tora]|uniref:Protein root UVB sensitive 6 n=1 Tax=Senna tora TaxID=362788 RepID=A0A834W6Z3_9FABA|nr:protein root UVB sensitive 6 [Senna tora]
MPQRTVFCLLTYAFDLFEEMPQRTAFYLLTYAFDVFEEMPQRTVPPNSCSVPNTYLLLHIRKNLPHLFLPLACAANVVQNVAVVTSTSTRMPIYKAFAKGENIGDVTAKGECVGNIADLKENSCRACGGNGNLLSCETCTYAYHPKCLLRPLKAPFLDNWRCPECVGPMILK